MGCSKHARLPCPSLAPRVCSDSCPLCQWCCLTISSSAALFSFCLQSFPALGSFPMSWFFASGGQSSGASVSASVLPMNIQGWFPLASTGWISWLSKGSSRVFSNTAAQKHQFVIREMKTKTGARRHHFPILMTKKTKNLNVDNGDHPELRTGWWVSNENSHMCSWECKMVQ